MLRQKRRTRKFSPKIRGHNGKGVLRFYHPANQLVCKASVCKAYVPAPSLADVYMLYEYKRTIYRLITVFREMSTMVDTPEQSQSKIGRRAIRPMQGKVSKGCIQWDA